MASVSWNEPFAYHANLMAEILLMSISYRAQRLFRLSVKRKFVETSFVAMKEWINVRGGIKGRDRCSMNVECFALDLQDCEIKL